LLLIDNYDSFTYNLFQYLCELGAEVEVVRNDAISPAEVEARRPSGLVISPGPGTPLDAGVSNDLIERVGANLPTLGVCLGLQCIAHVFGGRVVRAPELRHGKTSLVYHDGRGLFEGLPSPFEAVRYHSLIAERETLPASLEVSAWTADGLIMGLRHRELPIEGVQFHPESILTAEGKALLRNYLAQVERAAPLVGAAR
jgi:anthranilate synthase/aminodeoxychorismate synthase-like glutamine amidotransferase